VAVTGALGGGAGGLALWQRGERDLAHPLLQRYLMPQPRLDAGIALRGVATAAMDISDGLLADLTHLREASHVGVDLALESLPLAEGLVECLGHEQALTAALSGGDDYELLVTLPPDQVTKAVAQLAESGLSLRVIGRCTETMGVTGVPDGGATGWQHFRGGAS